MRIHCAIALAALAAGCNPLPKHVDLGSALPTATPAVTPPPAATNGTFPVLSSFDLNVTSNTAGGTTDAGNDNDEGGASSSSSAVAASSTGAFDATPYLQWTYSVGTNAGLGYEYAYVAFPHVSPQNASTYTGLQFKIKCSQAGQVVRVQFTGNAVDACIPAKNKMYVDYTIVASGTWYTVTLPFTVGPFVNRYPACPYMAGGWLSNIGDLSFTVSTVTGGTRTIGIDKIEYY